jgi:hypothetical protein
MVRDRLIPLASRGQWETALEGVPHSYWHTWNAHKAVADGNGRNAFLFVHEDLETGGRAACPFMERGWQDTRDIYTAIGFAGFMVQGNCPRVRASWEEIVRERGYVCGYFAVHPDAGRPELHVNLRDSHPLYTVDLTDGLDGVLRRSARTVRRTMADWLHAGHSYVEDRVAISQFLLANYGEFMNSIGASRSGRWSPDTLAGMLSDRNVIMVGASDELGICAAHTFCIGSVGADTHLNVSIRDGRSFTTPLLAWGFAELARRGIRRLGLGGGTQAGDSVARSKEKYRPTTAVLKVAAEVYDRVAFERLCRGAKHRDAPGSFFPPYRDATCS